MHWEIKSDPQSLHSATQETKGYFAGALVPNTSCLDKSEMLWQHKWHLHSIRQLVSVLLEMELINTDPRQINEDMVEVQMVCFSSPQKCMNGYMLVISMN